MRHGYVRQLEGTPGVAVLVAALVVVGVVVWLRLTDADSVEATAAASRPTSDTPAAAPPSPSVVLDPHAGVEVLPPRSMPPAPPAMAETSSVSDPVEAAVAFATQACAVLSGESEQHYRARVAAVSTPAAAAAWSHGSAQRVHCMQPGGTLQGGDAASASVLVMAVQVYTDPSARKGMRAYRWSATVTVVYAGDGWTVSS